MVSWELMLFRILFVTFDAKTKTIMIEKSVIREEGDWMPMKLWDGLPLLALKLRGKEELYDVPGVFDSGSSMGAFWFAFGERFRGVDSCRAYR